MKRGRPAQTYCSGGHKFDPDTIYTWTDPKGYVHRCCVICRRRARKEYRRREKRRLKLPLDLRDHKFQCSR